MPTLRAVGMTAYSLFFQTGLTSLHIAAWKGKAGVVEILVRAGCNPLIHSTNGKTALVLAQEEEQHECATILLAAMSKVYTTVCACLYSNQNSF